MAAGSGCSAMKKEWDRVRMRVLHWSGERPATGDELRTARGRRYLIISCTEKLITALVLPLNEPITGRVFQWTWGKRKKGS